MDRCNVCGAAADPDLGLCENCFAAHDPEGAAYREGRELGLSGAELEAFVDCEMDMAAQDGEAHGEAWEILMPELI